MSANDTNTAEVVAVEKCVWSGGGYAIWRVRTASGEVRFRLCSLGRPAVDFATEREATAAMAAMTA